MLLCKSVWCSTVAVLLWLTVLPQNITGKMVWDSLESIQRSQALTGTQKLSKIYSLKTEFEAAKLPIDSVYARVLLLIGVHEFIEKNDFKKAVVLTESSIRINNAGGRGSSKYFAILGYTNLAYFYKGVNAFNKALLYSDSAVMLARKVPQAADLLMESIQFRTYFFFQSGDYEKCVDESTIGMSLCLQQKDSSSYLYYYNQKIQAECFEDHVEQAASEIDAIIVLAGKMKNEGELATALATKALICKKKGAWQRAIELYRQAIQKRILAGDYHNAAVDYNDLGLLYMDSLNRYADAEVCYNKAIELGKKTMNNTTLALVTINIEENFFHRHNYITAARHCIDALAYLKIYCPDILANPSAGQLKQVEAKELILITMGNKANILLQLYKNTNDKKYLIACLQTAMVTDTLIDDTRHMQAGEESKLFWRGFAKRFYMNALDAAYSAKDNTIAFYFMEKSRAALLNDKLSELSAAAFLPTVEENKGVDYKIDVTVQQQKLASLKPASADYLAQQINLQQAQDNLQHYMRSIEERYASYYLYKYADAVPVLSVMQKHLATNKQSFIHYFIGDSAIFILATMPGNVQFVKLAANEFNRNDLADFQQLCADGAALNNNYAAFAKLSNRLYNKLFKQLKVPEGQVIICTDDFLIPFDALCTDDAGKNFLIYNYTFSYVYSASYLLRKNTAKQAAGNFLGIAPVSFASYTKLPDLTGSDDAVTSSSQHFKGYKLSVEDDATRRNFFKYAPAYAVVTLFSHASADPGNDEPVIYMRDSAIHLFELGYLKNPATQLVILSACETNVGKKAAGEGIFSLARGFSAAGISSVAATLWKADDQAIYAITESFNQNLALGMQKDSALRLAKLVYMQEGGKRLLPYYWANLIITGNIQPLQLKAGNYVNAIVITVVVVIVYGCIIALLLARRKIVKKAKQKPAEYILA